MIVEKERNFVSVVIIAAFRPETINLQWVKDKSIIFPSEASCGSTRRLEKNLSVFNVSKSIEIVCTNDRLQVTGLMEEQTRVVDICRYIFRLSQHEDILSVGINAAIEFTFHSHEDGYEFGNYFIPLKKWEKYMEEPRVLDFTIRDNKDPQTTKRIKSINIRSIKPKITAMGNIARVRMSVNNNFSIDDESEALSIIETALIYTDEFWKESESILSEI